jgi:hypothetical protein
VLKPIYRHTQAQLMRICADTPRTLQYQGLCVYLPITHLSLSPPRTQIQTLCLSHLWVQHGLVYTNMEHRCTRASTALTHTHGNSKFRECSILYTHTERNRRKGRGNGLLISGGLTEPIRCLLLPSIFSFRSSEIVQVLY